MGPFAFYADIVLLPETGDGLVILYNVSSFASNSLAAPRIKKGLIALLTDEQPATGGLSVRWVGAIIGLCTLVGVGVATNRLLRLPRWRQKAKTRPLWRLLLGIVGAISPALILLGFPFFITNTTGRAFSYAQLAKSMPDIFIWLGLTTILGAANAIIRVLLLTGCTRCPSHRVVGRSHDGRISLNAYETQVEGREQLWPALRPP